MVHPQALTPLALQRIARTEVELLRGLDHERWLLFDLDGNLLYTAEGDRYQVAIPGAVLRRLRPAAFSHNHLWELAHSEGDIVTATHEDFLLETRVVGAAHRYRLARPKTGWPDPLEVEDFLRDAWIEEWAMLEDGDPAASRLLRRRLLEQARGCYADPTDQREEIAWATCYLGRVEQFSSVFEAPFVVEPLP
jgi:hypothetical protein